MVSEVIASVRAPTDDREPVRSTCARPFCLFFFTVPGVVALVIFLGQTLEVYP